MNKEETSLQRKEYLIKSVESYIKSLSEEELNSIASELSCPARFIEPYKSQEEMVVDQILRMCGIKDYLER